MHDAHQRETLEKGEDAVQRDENQQKDDVEALEARTVERVEGLVP